MWRRCGASGRPPTLRQSHFFARAAPRTNIPPLPWGWQQSQRKVPPVPEQQLQPECRKRKLQENEPTTPIRPPKTLRVETLVEQTPEVVYAYLNLPVLSILPELQHFYPSITVNQLKAQGIVRIARALATERSIPLAGRLSHCLSNWQRVTQDRWFLEAIQGYKVPFVSTPYQSQLP